MIFKIEKPLCFNNGFRKYLVYNRDYSIQFLLGPDSDIDQIFDEGITKRYVEADPDQLELLGMYKQFVEDQPW